MRNVHKEITDELTSKKMSETQLYHKIEKEMMLACNKYGISAGQVDYSRIESPSTPGIPDINYCIKGREFWIECKVKHKDQSRNQLKPNQKAWHKRRTLAGGNVFVLRYSVSENITRLIKNEEMIYEGSMIGACEMILTVVGLI